MTTSSSEEALSIGEKLVEESLCACINVLTNMQSIYRWKGQIEKSTEAVLIVKAKTENYDLIENRVRDLHSYSTPCILKIPITAGYKPYLDWLKN